MADVPELERYCGSWICTSPTGLVREFFSRESVLRAAEAGWQVETAAKYLARINAAIKVGLSLLNEKE